MDLRFRRLVTVRRFRGKSASYLVNRRSLFIPQLKQRDNRVHSQVS